MILIIALVIPLIDSILSLKLNIDCSRNYHDVIVIGGGHSGCEAAAASSRVGAKTLLITNDLQSIGELSCNPSIGGIGKSQLVREIDALGGAMGEIADRSAIHYRILNRSRGPAVRGLRVQVDRDVYKSHMIELLSQYPNLEILQSEVDQLIIEHPTRNIPSVTGIKTGRNDCYFSKSVVLTTGTFLRGKCWIGKRSYLGGRFKRRYDKMKLESADGSLSDQLACLGLPISRFKTGTPPRLDSSTINYEILEKQPSEIFPYTFSHIPNLFDQRIPMICCYKSHTNKKTHEIVHAHLNTLPTFESGGGKGIGPRYCPSIATKVERFHNKESHTIWLEPEGVNSSVVFPNGLSGGFPLEIQQLIVKSIKGLEDAIIIKPGYDVEYDFVNPSSISHTCESKHVKNLFLCGQICGTTGYEEAAALGLVAGTNAALKAGSKNKFIIERSEGYIGVLLDDLISKDVSEPYRMFSSRAEHRLSLRNDNADMRLSNKGYLFNLVTRSRVDLVQQKKVLLEISKSVLRDFRLPINEWYKALLSQCHTKHLGLSSTKTQMCSAWDILSHPHFDLKTVVSVMNRLGNIGKKIDTHIQETLEADAKYEGYVQANEKVKAKRKDIS